MNQAVATTVVIQYGRQRRWYRYPAPRPGTRFSTTATHPAEAANTWSRLGADMEQERRFTPHFVGFRS